MLISINNPVQATLIFECILFVTLLLSIRFKKDKQIFPISQSQELKGLAILLIVFSHIGYFLVTDHRFLFPLSIMAGVGVDLFFFLSGLGLVASSIKKPLSILSFYRKNLLKLFTPFWISLILFFSLAFFVLKIAYPWQYILKSVFGFFTSASLYYDINSPLWFFTLILFYYLLFPLFFYKKSPWISAFVIYIISLLILRQNFSLITGVSYFYNLHVIAFPLGIIAAWLIYGERPQLVIKKCYALSKNTASRVVRLNVLKYLTEIIYYTLIIFLIVLIYYLAYVFGGQKNTDFAQIMSIITMLAVVLLFALKKVEFRLLQIFGLYSYEIYLLHWPILYHYDIFYKYLPAWMATTFYLIFFLGLAWLLKKLSELILNRTNK